MLADPSLPGPAGTPYSTMRNPTSRPVRRRLAIYGIAVTGFLICWAVLNYEFSVDFGLQVTIIAAMLAALPLFVVVPTYLWLDRYEAEPVRYRAFAFLWGALCAAAGALFVNTFFTIALSLSGSRSAEALGSVISAPLVEEGLKGAGILLLILLRRRQFDGIVDGIVYGGLIGAGFAFTENILYLGQVYVESGEEGLTWVFVLRCVMGPFAHPLFTSMTGVGLGIAVSAARTRGGQVAAGLFGYVGAILLHFVWNLTAVLASSVQRFVGFYFLVQVPIFVAYVGLLVWARTREGRLIRTYLSQYADAGWLGHDEVAMLGSLSQRRRARAWAKASGGVAAARSMRALQDAASDLALLRARMTRGVAEPAAGERERALLDAVVAHRVAFSGGPSAP